MRKRTVMIGVFLFLAVAWCMSAYAAEEVTACQGFWHSIGSFLYNALPWHWGNWMGK